MIPILPLAALLLIQAPMPAKPCLSDVVTYNLLHNDHPEVKAHVLMGRGVKTFVKIWNTMPPATDIVADEIVEFEWPGDPIVLLAFFKERCIVKAVPEHLETWQQVMKAVMGEKS